MAEQRTTGSGGTSPAQASSRQEHDTAQAVGTHVRDTARQIGDTASEYYEQGRDTAQAIGTQVRDTAQQVSKTASDYYEQGREQLAYVGQSLEEHIRGKPLQSVLMAAGVGMLLTFLWKR
jgi:ElaB/YqjD/DUF883 family membrane-anchored ribosome-binding protein